MNVKQLREELENYPDDLTVRFQYDTGDYWHHIIAQEIEFLDVLPVVYNDYVRRVIIDDNQEDNFIEDENMALILS